jgi:hypothetical protein
MKTETFSKLYNPVFFFFRIQLHYRNSKVDQDAIFNKL